MNAKQRRTFERYQRLATEWGPLWLVNEGSRTIKTVAIFNDSMWSVAIRPDGAAITAEAGLNWQAGIEAETHDEEASVFGKKYEEKEACEIEVGDMLLRDDGAGEWLEEVLFKAWSDEIDKDTKVLMWTSRTEVTRPIQMDGLATAWLVRLDEKR